MAREADSGKTAGTGMETDPADRIARMGGRTCLLAIDQMLALLPSSGTAGAAAEAAALARRVTRTAADYRAAATGLAGSQAGRAAPLADAK